jgi:two-component system, chemotaxis family, sensor kinase CheA
VAHVGESLLSRLRDGRLVLNADITSALLAMVDAVRRMLADIENTGSDGENDYAELVARLNELQEALTPAAEERPGLVEEAAQRPSLVEEAAKLTATASLETQETAPALEVAPAVDAAPDKAATERAPAEQAEAHGSAVADTTIRVDVHLLDKLMNLVGELVLARNQILQFTSTQQDSSFVATSQRLNLITTELQGGVMKTRMQPIGNIWSKFPRVVRDVALACGKQVRVEMEGRDTELDKTIIEAIKDPLTHVVRNAVDHGVESPEKRLAAGKPAEGRLFMRAFHEGGQVNIEISDDGGGIDPEKLKQKALQRGLVHADQLARMGEREVLNLIFLPGFSTAEKVTNVSGRGVGMDVVKTNIEKIGGAVDIHSKVGHGTTLKIKIPLTLAIIPALVVTSRGERYAIPQVSLLELVRLEADQAKRAIESIHGAPVYRLRGNLLPLVHLSRELRCDDAGTASGGEIAASAPSAESDAVNIVVLQADGRQFGLVVEDINDTEEIVVKPLGKQLKGISTFAGATIMGDGKVALILDVLGLAQRARVVSEVHDRAVAKNKDRDDATAAEAGERCTLLLLGMGEGARLAVPLDLVDRLEEFPPDAVETSAGQEVAQYRGQILPLIHLSDVLGLPRTAQGTEPLQVVVSTTHDGRTAGIVVDRILDIVDEALEVRRGVRRAGLLGSAVIQQKVTDLLDVHGIIAQACPAFEHAA